ncbi:MAG: polysaccharide biosynthesis protein, partial [Oscillospiraceae bacterium]
VPLFKRQIEHGGPVTVTDRRVVRYFMTIPEAVQLVLQAGAMAKDSEVFVLDMGDPMKIIELAENLVRLSGYVPYEDIPIVETGLRPGEKLYEELLIKNENLVKTENKKIFIEQQEAFSRAQVEYCLNRLDQALMSDVENLCQVMRELVPTYRTPDEVNTAAIAYNVDSDAYPLLQSL